MECESCHHIHRHWHAQPINVEKTAELFERMKAKVLYLDMMSIIEKLPLEKIREKLGKIRL
jgi:hypothetical protein